jgi:hypothetical protein
MVLLYSLLYLLVHAAISFAVTVLFAFVGLFTCKYRFKVLINQEAESSGDKQVNDYILSFHFFISIMNADFLGSVKILICVNLIHLRYQRSNCGVILKPEA